MNSFSTSSTIPAPSPYVSIPSEEWRKLADTTELPLSNRDIRNLASLGDPVDLAEVDAIYRPLSALIQMYARHTWQLLGDENVFLNRKDTKTPWIIGIAGSVAVGKSTAARLLQELMKRWPETPNVDLITTDGFLLPNEQLEQLGIMHRKGFPESYDRHGLIDLLSALKAGERNLRVPIYDHVTYDIVPGEYLTIDQPDILIVEGLNVLQPPRLSTTDGEFHAVSDYFDFSIYLDASEDSLEKWYIDRFHKLRTTAFTDERSFFKNYMHLSDQETDQLARDVWMSINLPNLRENIAPTRTRATVVLHKNEDHVIDQIHLRKL
ncbi:type I pantothenate kinase [Arcanobacterium pluranimalium]|uniref:type I pantothenate kinase n=1 Tax=Arcanobacterium pluranimalium TaxID=108028 RepID=UPI001956CF1D|nr:type I pantothenate kinase [Arcanobacterium pluranimalium]MBM7824977.1 type I pantothenate kinase [Arcanobacterium pluranimalium]